MLFEYDDSNEKSILSYAKQLKGRTFRDIKNEFDISPYEYYINPSERQHTTTKIIKEKEVGYITNTKAKGQLGGFLERYYFGYKPNNSPEPDFYKVGIELKQTCIDKKKNGEYRAGERLSITNISFKDPVEDDFYKSHLWKKMRRILLIHYHRDKSIERMDYQIKFINLFTPPEEDLKIIIEDYNKINAKIKAGKAHELSESDTLYLGACTKGSTSERSKRPQYYGKHEPAKSRNFCFKQSYMNYILHTYILNKADKAESIITKETNLRNLSFEDFVIKQINQYKGKTDKELCDLFNREYNSNKAQWIDLSYRMLGIKSNKAKEFEKAGIVVKAIRVEQNGKNKENMSFPPFKFKELIQEKWEESTIYKYFDTTKFLFVIFKSNGDCYELLGSQLWNMPYSDLNTTVKKGWTSIRNKIKYGITFTIKSKNNKLIVYNDLPKIRDNEIIHIRPHASKAAYLLKNGFTIGNIEKDANELPNGEKMTTQSFWINNNYILKQLKYK